MNQAVRVGFWPRVGAALLDVLILLLVFGVGAVPMIYLETKNRMTPELEYAFGIAASLGALAYASFEIFKAGTPGKMLLGQRIVTVEGKPAASSALFWRYAVKHLPEVIGLVAAVTALAALDRITRFADLGMGLAALGVLGASRQALWDQIAGTIVMRTKDLQEVPGFQPLMTSLPLQPVSPVEPPAPPQE